MSLRKISICVILILTLFTFQAPIFATSPLSSALESLQNTEPFTKEYIHKADELSIILKNSNKDDNPLLYTHAQNELHLAIDRTYFLLNDIVTRLGSDLNLSIDNAPYVKKTLDSFDDVYKLSAFKEMPDLNSESYKSFKSKTERLIEFNDEIKIVEDIITLLDYNDTNIETEFTSALNSYNKLQDDKYLVNKDYTYYLSDIANKLSETTVILPKTIQSIDGIHSATPNEDGEIKITTTPIDKKLSESLEKDLLTNYEVVDAFKVLLNGKGGKIPTSTFTLPKKYPNSYLINTYGEIYADISETDAPNSKFENDSLGDFFIVTPQDHFPYNTNYSSKLDCKYQNYVINRLIYESTVLSSNVVSISANQVDRLPSNVLKTLADNGEILEIIGDETVKLMPQAFLEMNYSAEFIAIDILYKYAKATQDNEKFATITSPDIIDADDLTLDERQEKTDPFIKTLSIAGILVTIVLLIFIIERNKKLNKT